MRVSTSGKVSVREAVPGSAARAVRATKAKDERLIKTVLQ
jgi:hypothetical protein